MKLLKFRENPSPWYRGFHLVKHPDCERYQVRWYQHDPTLTHVWTPWCDTIEEAKAVVDKLIHQMEAD